MSERASELPALPIRTAPGPCVANGCSACCHDVEMLLTDSDVQRIAAAYPGKDFFFQADDGYLQLRTRDGHPAKGWAGGSGIARAPQSQEEEAPPAAPRPCIFLRDDGACGIHAIRPEGCRLYPAVWDEGLRDVSLDEDYCPHTEGFALPGRARDDVKRLADRLQRERRARLAAPSPGARASDGL